MTFPGPSSQIQTRVVALFIAFKVMLLVASGNIFAGEFTSGDFFSSVLSSENIVAMTNDVRVAQGGRKLLVSKELTEAAKAKAEDMFEKQYFSHVSSDGLTPWDFLREQKYAYLYAGENLAMRYDSAEKVIESWISSIEHRENIMSKRYTHIGVAAVRGVYQGESTVMIVEFFARPFVSPLSSRDRAFRAARADISDSVDGSSDLSQLYGVGREKTMDGRELVSIFKRIYFYIALILLADIVFRFFWLSHYKDRRTTLYTAGAFFALLTSMLIG